MSSFDIYKRIDLAYLGDAWKECFLEFGYLTVEEAKEFAGIKVDQNDKQQITDATDLIINLLEKKFIKGKAIREGQTVDVKYEDIKQFPFEVLNKCVQVLVGVPTEAEKKEA